MPVKCPLCLNMVELLEDGRCPSCGGQTGMSPGAEDIAPVRRAASPPRRGRTVDEKRCPMCGERVSVDATGCDYCGEDLGHGTVRGIWREGNVLVMLKEAELPNRCVKSNAPTSRKLERKLSWHHPVLYVAIFACGVIPYIILALLLQKRATISVGLSEEWFARRRRAILVGWGVSLAAIGMFFGSVILFRGNDGAVGGMMVMAVIIGLVGAIYGMTVARIVTPAKIDDTHVWVKGIHPDFLDDLPDWRGSR